MILEFTFDSQPSTDWPAVKVIVNGREVADVKLDQPQSVVTVNTRFDQDQNSVGIDYYNKTPNHTIMHNDKIVQDQCVKFVDMRIDDILVEPWVWHHGVYLPRYFQGFADAHPSAPDRIIGDRHWFFPGTYVMGPWPIEDKFWHWYRDERRSQILRIIEKIDGNREDSHMGSLENFQGDIDKIKRLIGV